MMPWGHLAVGYLTYSVGARAWRRSPPGGRAVLALGVGTQLPDLIDKPLNWWFGVFDGRALGHSALTMAVLCGVVVAWSRRRGREELGIAFVVGVATHLLTDSWRAFLEADLGNLGYLLWPVFSAPTYPKDSLFDHLDEWAFRLRLLLTHSPEDVITSQFGLQLFLFVCVLVVWAIDGFPGLRMVWRAVADGQSSPR